jgi:hypothetical protein
VLHRVADFLIAIVDYIPALFLEQDSPNFQLVRAVSLLLAVPLVIAVFALVGHVGFKVVAHFKTLSRKRAPGPAASITRIDTRRRK